MSGKNSIIAEIENEQMDRDFPEFAPGDTIVVQVKVKEGTRERLQAYEGVVLYCRLRAVVWVRPSLYARSPMELALNVPFRLIAS